jgi:hypothetical protein
MGNGIMEYWNTGIMGNKEIPLKPDFPIFHCSNIDELVKSRNSIEFVIPAKAGIQGSR